ncbi:hypothetical protein BOX15_Mlig014237g1, partial [Macrostomum lignano]
LPTAMRLSPGSSNSRSSKSSRENSPAAILEQQQQQQRRRPPAVQPQLSGHAMPQRLPSCPSSLSLQLLPLLLLSMLLSPTVSGTAALSSPLKSLSPEERRFLAQGIHVTAYQLTDAESRHSVTVSQRALLENRRSLQSLRQLFGNSRPRLRRFLRSLQRLR